ncbi:insulinase family protein [Sphingomonas sp.]|uniref:M16 family metallopeptidase n=1 Tax=Sphingomonas sp. TaxID=28214 RepID=UPI00286A77FB|nr:insulinase family protein [Sphingomonas sp.]
MQCQPFTRARLRACSSGIAVALSLAFIAPPALAAAPARANGWGVALTDVTPDLAIRYGTLANGMKYAILANATPKGTASVRLHFAFGSIGEGENERGLAHFIEHMAFNGTTHVPEGDMVKILERQGLAFGPDTNAQTGFDSTTYMLDLPQTDAEHVDTAMFLLREVASEVTFAPAAVNAERGVILGEKRARDSYQIRQLIDLLGFQLPATPYPNRIPIGTDAVLNNATAATIHDLYRRYYRPENATLVFVGDADPAVIQAKIEKAFASWQDNGAAGAPLPRGTVDFNRPASFDNFIDPAVPTIVDMSVMRPWTDDVDTSADRRRKIVEGLATAIFNRRLQRLANVPNSPLLGAGMLTQDQKDAARVTTVKIIAKDGSWKPAVAAAEQEVRRTLDHGFSAREMKTQLAETESQLRTAAEQANTRTNQALAGAILSVIGEKKFVTTPRYRLDQFDAVAPSLTPAEVDAAFHGLWTGSAPLVHLSDKQDVPIAQLAAAFTDSHKIAVAAPAETAGKAFAYDSFGPLGTVVADQRIADLGVRTVRFANHVRLNIKKTDFEVGKVRFLVRFGGGLLDLPRDQPGLGPMMSIVSGVGAVSKHSLEELKELTAGKVVTLGAAVSDDAFIATGATTPADLGLQMKLSTAYLVDPGYRPEAASQWANLVPVIEKSLSEQPQNVAQTRLPVLLANGDERFGLPVEAVLSKRNFAEARAALAPVIAAAPIEVTIVGDVDEAAAIAAVAASFGALPPRQPASAYTAARKVTFRSDRTPISLTHAGPADQALVQAVWPTSDDRNYRTVVGLDLLKDVLDLMLTASVREKLGDSYGVSLGSTMSSVYPNFGYLSASAVVAPGKADEVQQAFADAAAQLRDKPVTDDLLARARNPELQALDRAMRDNGFWLAALDEAQSKPDRLNRIRQRRALLTAITPADLRQLAVLYLQPGKLQQARIVSSKLAAPSR